MSEEQYWERRQRDKEHKKRRAVCYFCGFLLSWMGADDMVNYAFAGSHHKVALCVSCFSGCVGDSTAQVYHRVIQYGTREALIEARNRFILSSFEIKEPEE